MPVERDMKGTYTTRGPLIKEESSTHWQVDQNSIITDVLVAETCVRNALATLAGVGITIELQADTKSAALNSCAKARYKGMSEWCSQTLVIKREVAAPKE